MTDPETAAAPPRNTEADGSNTKVRTLPTTVGVVGAAMAVVGPAVGGVALFAVPASIGRLELPRSLRVGLYPVVGLVIGVLITSAWSRSQAWRAELKLATAEQDARAAEDLWLSALASLRSLRRWAVLAGLAAVPYAWWAGEELYDEADARDAGSPDHGVGCLAGGGGGGVGLGGAWGRPQACDAAGGPVRRERSSLIRPSIRSLPPGRSRAA